MLSQILSGEAKDTEDGHSFLKSFNDAGRDLARNVAVLRPCRDGNIPYFGRATGEIPVARDPAE